MGRHEKKDNRDFSAKSPAEQRAELQRRANEFDAQHQRITERSQGARDRGEGAWSTDKKIKQAGTSSGGTAKPLGGGCALIPFLILAVSAIALAFSSAYRIVA